MVPVVLTTDKNPTPRPWTPTVLSKRKNYDPRGSAYPKHRFCTHFDCVILTHFPLPMRVGWQCPGSPRPQAPAPPGCFRHQPAERWHWRPSPDRAARPQPAEVARPSRGEVEGSVPPARPGGPARACRQTPVPLVGWEPMRKQTERRCPASPLASGRRLAGAEGDDWEAGRHLGWMASPAEDVPLAAGDVAGDVAGGAAADVRAVNLATPSARQESPTFTGHFGSGRLVELGGSDAKGSTPGLPRPADVDEASRPRFGSWLCARLVRQPGFCGPGRSHPARLPRRHCRRSSSQNPWIRWGIATQGECNGPEGARLARPFLLWPDVGFGLGFVLGLGSDFPSVGVGLRSRPGGSQVVEGTAGMTLEALGFAVGFAQGGLGWSGGVAIGGDGAGGFLGGARGFLGATAG